MAARVVKLRRLFRNGNPRYHWIGCRENTRLISSRRARHGSGRSESRQATGVSPPRFAITLEDEVDDKDWIGAAEPRAPLPARHSGIAGDLGVNGSDRYAEVFLQIRKSKWGESSRQSAVDRRKRGINTASGWTICCNSLRRCSLPALGHTEREFSGLRVRNLTRSTGQSWSS
jgi:hypothetical protein